MPMIANYHTHTWRCNHASGTEREYAQSALAAGLHTLGFSDHTPYIFPGEYYSHFRMKLSQLEDYVGTVLSLREEYTGRLNIPLGLETEYYPQLLPKLLPVLRDQPLDYLILGQHFVGNEYDSPYSGLTTFDEGLLRQYVDQSVEALQTGLFSCFAHPDLLNFRGDGKVYQREMTRLCREAKGCNIPLEYNLLGLSEGKHYPNRLFWEVAAAEGCPVILGRDAHAASALQDHRSEQKALAQLAALGITPQQTLSLKKI